MNEKEQPWYTSIVAVIIAMICFWPVGCVLLYLRIINNKGKYRGNTYMLITLAVILILFGIVGLSVFFYGGDSSDFFLATLMFIIPGAVCAFFSYKRMKQLKIYKKYSDYISVRKKVEIEGICSKLNVDYDTAVSTLTDMISKDMIKGYLTENELIIGKQNSDNLEVNYSEQTKKKEVKIVKCKSCGAKNTVVEGETKECEYCGTLLQ